MRNLFARQSFGLLLIFFLSLGAAHAQVSWQYEWLGEGIVYSPSAVADADGTITVFIVDKDDGAVRYRRLFTNGTSSGWESLGFVGRSDPSAVARAPGQMTVFIRGSSGGISYRTWLGGTTWNEWTVLGGNAVSGGPRAISLGDGRMAVFIVGDANHIRYRLFEGSTWGVWEDLGNSCTIVRPISWGAGHMAVFARCGGSLQYRTWQGGSAWTPWQVIESNLTEFEVASWGPNRYDIVANEFSSSPTRLKRLWFDGTWHSEILPDSARNVGIASPAPGVVDFFYQRVGSGFDDVSHRRLEASQLTPRASLPRDADGHPVGFASGASSHVFVRGLQFDYNLLHFQAPRYLNGTVRLTGSDLTVPEHVGSVTVYVSRTGGSGPYGAASVTCSAVGITATGGADFSSAPQSIQWPAGDTSEKPCTIPITNDGEHESDETFYFTLSSPNNVGAGGSNIQVTIADNDPAPPQFPGTPRWTAQSCENPPVRCGWDTMSSTPVGVGLSWAPTAGGPAQRYELQVLSPATNNAWWLAQNSSSTSFTYTVFPDEYALFRVRACNSSGCSLYGPEYAVTVIMP